MMLMEDTGKPKSQDENVKPYLLNKKPSMTGMAYQEGNKEMKAKVTDVRSLGGFWNM